MKSVTNPHVNLSTKSGSKSHTERKTRMKTSVHTTLPTALLALLVSAGFAQQSVTLDFAAMVNDQEVECGVMYEGVGAEGSTIEFQDMRFYISDVRLISADGEEVALELEPNQWQHQNVALLDFEDGTARCAQSGNEATNSSVMGSVSEGDYTGVVFALGVPFDLNHADVANAPTPLNISSMWWSWQGGYKHARIDLMSHSDMTSAAMNMQDSSGESAEGHGEGGEHAQGGQEGGHSGHGGAAQAGLWPIHIGSTGCDSSASVIAPATPCANPNVTDIRLENIDLEDTIIADVNGLLDGVDVSQSLETAPPGCMSGPEDPDCDALFSNLSLAADVNTQTFFRVEGRSASQ